MIIVWRVACSAILAFGGFVLLIASIPDDAEARRFRGSFSAGGAASSRAYGRVGRTADEIAVETKAEGFINWPKASELGLDVAKKAMEEALKSISTSSPRPAFNGDTLTRFELEACIRESGWLDERETRFEANSQRVQARRTEIERVERDIESARFSVNTYSQQSVDAFNARIHSHRQMVNHFNSVILPEIDRERLAFNARVETYNRYCNGKRYYADDLAAVETKLGGRKAY